MPQGLLIAAKQMCCFDGEKQPQILRLRAALRRFAQDDKALLLLCSVKLSLFRRRLRRD